MKNPPRINDLICRVMAPRIDYRNRARECVLSRGLNNLSRGLGVISRGFRTLSFLLFNVRVEVVIREQAGHDEALDHEEHHVAS